MNGMLNLLVILMVISNAKNVIISFKENGNVIQAVWVDFLESKRYLELENYYTISALFTLPFFTASAYWIEILASKRWVHRPFVWCLIALNQAILLGFPIVFSFVAEPSYGLASFFYLYVVSLHLKTVSFHHTMHDVRGTVNRAISLKKEGKTYKMNTKEGTVFGIKQEVFDIAMTYPKCLQLENYFRFMISPTFCY